MSFLGVGESAKGFTWIERRGEEALVQQLAALPGVDPFAAHLLAARQVSPDTLETFLRPRLRDLLPDPNRLKGFEAFETAFFAAQQNGEPIGILADYDVDGATSAAVLVALFGRLI